VLRSVGRDPDASAPRGHLRIATPAAALVVGGLIVVMLISAAAMSSMAHQFNLSGLGQAGLYLSFGVVGVVVARHQPRNPMGWVLLGVTFFFILDVTASQYAYLDYRLHDGRLPLGWLAGCAAGPVVGPGHRAGRAVGAALPGRAGPVVAVEADAGKPG
jgi:uncharacterized membrane protein YhaH (DUF805 family)